MNCNSQIIHLFYNSNKKILDFLLSCSNKGFIWSYLIIASMWKSNSQIWTETWRVIGINPHHNQSPVQFHFQPMTKQDWCHLTNHNNEWIVAQAHTSLIINRAFMGFSGIERLTESLTRMGTRYQTNSNLRSTTKRCNLVFSTTTEITKSSFSQ